MLVAIPVLVDLGIAQSEIGAEVDDLQVPRQVADHLLAGRVRQRAETKIDAREIDLPDFAELGQVQMPQMREDLGHGLPGLAVGGKGDDFHPRMGRDQAHKFGTRIAAGPQNRDPVLGHRPALLAAHRLSELSEYRNVVEGQALHGSPLPLSSHVVRW